MRQITLFDLEDIGRYLEAPESVGSVEKMNKVAELIEDINDELETARF